jgi:hypothetical protein
MAIRRMKNNGLDLRGSTFYLFSCKDTHIWCFFVLSASYLHKNIYKQQCKKWKGIDNGHHNLFQRATKKEMKSEQAKGSRTWASLINRTPLAKS